MFAAHRLRVALELAPVEAISYAASNPIARWQIIHDHLVKRYPLTTDDLIKQLARRIAVTLADWQEARTSTTPHRRAVWVRSRGKCSACHYDFAAKSSPALARLDPFKPYYRSPDELTSEEIDHLVAISGVGTNDINNLQLLCRWCNFGKGDGLGVDIRREAEYAAIPIDDIPRSHVASLFYMTLADNGFACQQCGAGDDQELTVRLRDDERGFLLSNLRSSCYQCLAAEQSSSQTVFAEVQ
jgi:5-methylcytosine-specific restriction endonuclease McrA